MIPLRRLRNWLKRSNDALDYPAIEALHSFEWVREVARLGPERYVQLGFHNDLPKDWDAILNFQFFNYSWPYMPSLALVSKTQPPNLTWGSDFFSLIEIGLDPTFANEDT